MLVNDHLFSLKFKLWTLNNQSLVKTQLFFCGSLCHLDCTPICHRSNPAKKFLTKIFVFSRVVQNYQTYKCQVWSNLPEKKVTHSSPLSFQCPPSSPFQYMNCHPQGCFGYFPPQKKGENTKQIFRVSSNLAWCSISPFKFCDEHIYNWIKFWEDNWWLMNHLRYLSLTSQSATLICSRWSREQDMWFLKTAAHCWVQSKSHLKHMNISSNML